jgi:DNA-binding transcriptional ArsR family regulator
MASLTKKVEIILDIWSDLAAFGERYLSALQAYREVFFSEEEERIRPALENSLQKARQLAQELSMEALIEKVSRGVRFEDGIDVAELVMVPSYWITPLVVNMPLKEGQGLFLFGARPEDDSLVPGAQVPDGMLRTLKTLADPTRLKILRYLSQKTMSPAHLARRLRLRAPTVTHHLNALRLAGLVYLTLGEKKRKFYTTRSEAISGTISTLEDFLSGESEESLDE